MREDATPCWSSAKAGRTDPSTGAAVTAAASALSERLEPSAEMLFEAIAWPGCAKGP